MPAAARAVLDDADVETWFSAVSIWEVAIKSGLGRADFQADARRLRRGLLDNGRRELAVSSEHAIASEDLPQLYKAPFDRMLAAQSNVEGVMLITSNAEAARSSGRVRQV